MAGRETRQRRQTPSIVPIRPAPEETETEIDLVELFYYLLEHVKYIIAATLLGAILLGVASFFIIQPQYESTAKLYVLNSSDSAINLSDLQIGSYLTSDYQEVFKTWEVNERVINELGLTYTYEELHEMLTITNPSNTRIIYITVKSNSAHEAALIANEYAQVAREYIADTMAAEAPNVLSTALEEIKPVSPNKTLNTILGALGGAFITIAVLVVLFVMDDKIHTADDITKYAGIQTIATVPLVSAQDGGHGKGGGALTGKNGRADA